ncbi:hypothetical protein [Paraurantiacibacter namhicola]|uniref:Uncharacterized protein n=1 Tax=Paraurantiacibacter namhicola TaxID=645517 RepID=A0A1C7D8V2_9SPHN|nr:hypothetical protein [Paraurantiacibacter namhicola]ANU07782.1 hypothetical protein A6F65_01478 [Paraurantiacibacter namhicola]
MKIYEDARRHALTMFGILAMGVLFVIAVERIVGHSSIAFAVVAVALIIANRRSARYNCPRCGSNLFWHGWLPMPWPNSTCSKCELDLTQKDQ